MNPTGVPFTQETSLGSGTSHPLDENKPGRRERSSYIKPQSLADVDDRVFVQTSSGSYDVGVPFGPELDESGSSGTRPVPTTVTPRQSQTVLPRLSPLHRGYGPFKV